MSRNHLVAGWKLDGTIEFDYPKAITRRPRGVDEVMVSMVGKGRDIRVTANHRMIRQCGRKKFWRDVQALDLVGRAFRFPVSGIAEPLAVEPTIQYVSDRSRRRREVALAYSYRQRGMIKEEAAREARVTVSANLERKAKVPKSLTLDECRFIGFWLGDGSLYGGRCTLAQSKRYPKIIAWVDVLLSRLGYACSRVENAARQGQMASVHWTIARGTGSRCQAREAGYFTVEPYLKKCGSPLLWGLNTDQFSALLDGFWLADGNHGDGETPSERGRSVTGAQRPLYDLIQAIGTCRGFHVTLRPEISFNRRKPAHHSEQFCLAWNRTNGFGALRQKLHVEPLWLQEDVWCVTSSTGYIVTRRKGKVAIVGNSTGFDFPELDTVVLARPTVSLAVYQQQLGRVMRPHPAKADAWVIDMVDQVGQFGKIEDLRLKPGGRTGQQWQIVSGTRQLTNIYFVGGDRLKTRLRLKRQLAEGAAW